MNEGKKRPDNVAWSDIDMTKVETVFNDNGDKTNTVVVTIKQDGINSDYIQKEFDKWAKLRNDEWKSSYEKK